MKKYKVLVSPLALADVKEVKYWYEKIRKELAEEFILDLKRKFYSLKINPLAFAIRHGNTRFAMLDVFPYHIHFEVDEVKLNVYVSSVIHVSRNPAYRKEKDL